MVTALALLMVAATLALIAAYTAEHLVRRRLIARRNDLRLLTAVDGHQGVALARSCLPDVILMDINLPGISGVEALQLLRHDAATAHIPVMALSANAMARDVESGLEAGFFRYLTKPIKVPAFMKALDLALAFAEEETPDAAVASSRTAVTLAPSGNPRRAVVVEPARGDDWSDAHRLALHQGGPGVRCSTATNRRLDILLHGTPGAPYTITWDGIPLRRRLLRTPSDRFTVRPATRAGVLRIEAGGPSEPLTAWAACSPLAPDADAAVFRRAYALRAGHPLRIPFVADPENPGYANVIVYGPSSGLIRATIDGGQPERRAGPVQLLTMASRTIQWTDVRLESRLDRDATPLSAPVSAAIPLGGDLAAGAHTLELEWLPNPPDGGPPCLPNPRDGGPPCLPSPPLEASEAPVWVRVFRYH